MERFSSRRIKSWLEALRTRARWAGSRNLQILIVVLVGFASFLIGLDRNWGTDDDHLYIYTTSRMLGTSGAGDAYFAETLATLRELQYEGHGIGSIESRRKNAGNYILVSASYRLVSHVFEWVHLIDRKANYPGFMVFSLYFGYVASFGVCLALLAIALYFLGEKERTYVLYTVCWLAILAFLSYYVSRKSSFFRFSGFQSVQEFVPNLLAAFINPGTTYGLFGPSPRSNVLALALGIAALRLSGHIPLSYWFILPSILVHRQLGTLLLGSLLAVDVVTRPLATARWRVLLPTALAAGYFLATERFWEEIGLQRQPSLYLGLLFLLLLGVFWGLCRAVRRASGPGKAAPGVFFQVRGFLARHEAVCLAFLWLAAYATAGVAVPFTPRDKIEYFWGVLPGRYLALLQPIFWLHIWRYLDALSRRSPGLATFRAPAAAVLLVAQLLPIGAAARISHGRTIERSTATMRRFEAWALTGLAPGVSYSDEAILYYAIAKSLDLKTDLVRPLLENQGKSNLHWMVIREDFKEVERMLRAGADPDAIGSFPVMENGRIRWLQGTPLLAAVHWGETRMVRLLLRLGADIRNPRNQPAPCVAVMRSHGSVYWSLVAAGSAPTTREQCVNARR